VKRLLVRVKEVRGRCNIHKPGDYFEVVGGRIMLTGSNKYVCMYSLSSLMPLLPAKQRNIVEPDDWLPKVKEVECPDPEGVVIWEIIEVGEESEN